MTAGADGLALADAERRVAFSQDAITVALDLVGRVSALASEISTSRNAALARTAELEALIVEEQEQRHELGTEVAQLRAHVGVDILDELARLTIERDGAREREASVERDLAQAFIRVGELRQALTTVTGERDRDHRRATDLEDVLRRVVHFCETEPAYDDQRRAWASAHQVLAAPSTPNAARGCRV